MLFGWKRKQWECNMSSETTVDLQAHNLSWERPSAHHVLVSCAPAFLEDAVIGSHTALRADGTQLPEGKTRLGKPDTVSYTILPLWMRPSRFILDFLEPSTRHILNAQCIGLSKREQNNLVELRSEGQAPAIKSKSSEVSQVRFRNKTKSPPSAASQTDDTEPRNTNTLQDKEHWLWSRSPRLNALVHFSSVSSKASSRPHTAYFLIKTDRTATPTSKCGCQQWVNMIREKNLQSDKALKHIRDYLLL